MIGIIIDEVCHDTGVPAPMYDRRHWQLEEDVCPTGGNLPPVLEGNWG